MVVAQWEGALGTAGVFSASRCWAAAVGPNPVQFMRYWGSGAGCGAGDDDESAAARFGAGLEAA